MKKSVRLRVLPHGDWRMAGSKEQSGWYYGIVRDNFGDSKQKQTL